MYNGLDRFHADCQKDKVFIAYHGTNTKFEEFDNQFFGNSSGNEQYGSGFYFTNKKDVAQGYGDNVYKVKLSFKNPFVIESGETTSDIYLSEKQIRSIVSQHPNIRITADNDEIYNPLGDWSESFWKGCNSDNPDFEKNLRQSFDETINLLMKCPTLLNIDMFYENSGVPKHCFLDAVRNATGHDGIVVSGKTHDKNKDVDIYVAWDKSQIEKILNKSRKTKQNIELD